MAALRIVLGSVLAAVFYGIVHDQITVRICVEYFTIGHARIIESESPTLLAIAWGVVATWWVGLFLGTGLAIAARAGGRPKLSFVALRKPIGILVSVMFVCAILGGALGYLLTRAELIFLVEPFASQVPEHKHTAFLIDAWAHSASYLSGLIGGICLWVSTWRRRKHLLKVGR